MPATLPPTVEHWMSHPVVTVPTDTPAAVCAEIMSRTNHRHLVVVDPDGRMEGVVTDAALMALELAFVPQAPEPVAEGLRSSELTAGDLALVPRVRTAPQASLRSVLDALAADSQDIVVVVEPGERPAGVITEHDVVRLAALHGDPMPTVDDLPPSELVVVGPHQSRRLARILMKASGVRHLLVCDEQGLVGVLSWRDLGRRGVQLGGEALARDLDARVADLLGRAPITVDPGTSLRRAAGLMTEHKIGLLPVVDDQGQPVTAISRTDLVPYMMRSLFP